MRIKAISLSWFRGAADSVSMEPDGKSIVVYGVNASGKSSFVDAIEYVMTGGKIGHLSHEYSGKHLENAVPNTHRPKGRTTRLSIKFSDNSEAKTEIAEDGAPKSSGSMLVAMGMWDYRRTVLRQDEVAAFIHDTKGGKYSALLPLLGLHQIEIAAENLRRLAKAVETASELKDMKSAIKQADTRRKEVFGTAKDDEILKTIETLRAKYCRDQPSTKDPVLLCADLATALERRTAQLSADQRKHFTLRAASELQIKKHIAAVRSASVKLADAVDPLISEKLAVLQPAEAWAGKLTVGGETKCPACGQSMGVTELQAHVRSELERLHEIRSIFNQRNVAMGDLCDSVKSLKSSLNKPDVKSWREEVAKGPLEPCFAYLDDANAEALRTACSEDTLREIDNKLLPLVDAAASASTAAPPDVQRLSTDKGTVDAARTTIEARRQATSAAQIEELLSIVAALEQHTREEIRRRSKATIDEISADIQKMWAILHPGEAIEDVRLYIPKDTDKAIDICLKFHGKEQESPRLTLSEGYRNSLGLCIFLAMAKREAGDDRPVFLDDVIVSLDRNHRGMIVELLQREFSARQVIILTHDRDWYTELRQQLVEGTWTFKTLLPYENPELGIRWSHKTTTFDDARAQLIDRPDSAGNDARKIMDVELAIIAERLRIRLPYLRFDKNDRRTAHDFLERLVAEGRKCFQKQEGKDYVFHEGAAEALKKTDQMLISWGNRASHTFDVVRPEATKLIEACEQAIESFRCASCNKRVWFAEAEGTEWFQCQCGALRWRYGKA